MRSNYSREERQKIVEEYIQSGKSQTVFAPEYGIKPNTLSAWVTKYKSAEACQAADVHFVELKSTFIKEKQNMIIRVSVKIDAYIRKSVLRILIFLNDYLVFVRYSV